MVNHYTERPGLYSKLESLEMRRRPMIWGLLGMLFIEFVIGFLLGLLVRGTVAWMVGGTVAFGLTMVLVYLVVFHKVLPRFEEIQQRAARRSVAVMRGATAEALVSVRFRDALDDAWHLFDNLKLDATSDIDHVLVGPAGLFVVSTKGHRGTFRCGPGGSATLNSEPCDWPQDVTRQALRLKEQLKALETAEQPWIQAILALPFARIETANDKPAWPAVGHVWVLHDEDLVRAIAPDEGKRRLSKAEAERWAAALRKLHERYGDVVAERCAA